MLRYALLVSLTIACESVPSQAQSPTVPIPSHAQVATFAGGCFWCMETAFEGMKGVFRVTSGYMGGPEKNPTYAQVSRGQTGHAEVVQVVFDPNIVSYELLLTTFWFNVDPFAVNRQFCDRGAQYRSGIFFHDQIQEAAARSSLKAAKSKTRLQGRFSVEITAASVFYEAEAYHQDYYRKNPIHYKRYRLGCGRDKRLQQIWGVSQSGVAIQKKQASQQK